MVNWRLRKNEKQRERESQRKTNLDGGKYILKLEIVEKICTGWNRRKLFLEGGLKRLTRIKGDLRGCDGRNHAFPLRH